jgi:hypothetical protein
VNIDTDTPPQGAVSVCEDNLAMILTISYVIGAHHIEDILHTFGRFNFHSRRLRGLHEEGSFISLGMPRDAEAE